MWVDASVGMGVEGSVGGVERCACVRLPELPCFPCTFASRQ